MIASVGIAVIKYRSTKPLSYGVSVLVTSANYPTRTVRQSKLRRKLTRTSRRKYDQISENHVIQSRYVRVLMSLWFFISRSSHVTKQKRKKTECNIFIEHSHVETGVK